MEGAAVPGTGDRHAPMTDDLARGIKAEAARLGFDRVGIAKAEASEHGAFYRAWLARGHHGEMGYLARPDAVERREDPSLTLPGVRSVVVVADAYVAGGGGVDDDASGGPDSSRGLIARYARGADYHRVLRGKLERLRRWTEDQLETEGRAGKVYVDTGPVLERELARRAGLGWFGRNTMLIHPRRGSYFFLGALFLEVPLPPDEPFAEDRCGSCRACLDACPTGALLGRDETGAPVMDARRCISYLTIELRGPIPRDLRPAVGNRIFGCDICQEVCPWNQRFPEQARPEGRYAARGPGELPVGVEALPGEASVTAVTETTSRTGPGDQGGSGIAPHPGPEAPKPGSEATHPGTRLPTLIELLETALAPEAWDAFSRASPLRRPGRAGFARNVCVALGNWGSPEAIPVLVAALDDEDPLVRGHAAWALGEIGGPEAAAALASRLGDESEASVLAEIRAALAP
jgi:epoxyqueuosine reductase